MIKSLINSSQQKRSYGFIGDTPMSAIKVLSYLVIVRNFFFVGKNEKPFFDIFKRQRERYIEYLSTTLDTKDIKII
jgi:hypothetical protein